MKPGDIVRRKMYPDDLGLFMGLVTFKSTTPNSVKDYTCAEVMWFGQTATNGDMISTIQHNLIEVVDESG